MSRGCCSDEDRDGENADESPAWDLGTVKAFGTVLRLQQQEEEAHRVQNGEPPRHHEVGPPGGEGGGSRPGTTRWVLRAGRGEEPPRHHEVGPPGGEGEGAGGTKE